MDQSGEKTGGREDGRTAAQGSGASSLSKLQIHNFQFLAIQFSNPGARAMWVLGRKSSAHGACCTAEDIIYTGI